MDIQRARYTKCNDCMQCVFAKKRHTVVGGYGNPRAEVMFVGECPREEENISGFPYTGDEGNLLWNHLANYLGIDLLSVYVTYAIKCWPGRGRGKKQKKIKKEHIEACTHYLKDELEMVRPKYIIALGKIALSSIYGKTVTYDELPEYFEYIYQDGTKAMIMATYQPLYILADLKRLPYTQKHFSNLRKIMTGQEIKIDEKYTLINSVEKMEQWMAKEIKPGITFMAADIETVTLGIDIPTGISFCVSEDNPVFIPLMNEPMVFPYEETKKSKGQVLVTKKEWIAGETIVNAWLKEDGTFNTEEFEKVVNYVKQILADFKIQKSFHNGSYDIKVLEKNGFKVNNFYLDTYVAGRLHNITLSRYRLKDLAYYYLDYPYYDKELKPYLKSLPKPFQKYYVGIPLEPLAKYACLDTKATLQLSNLFINTAKGKSYEKVLYDISMPARRALTKAEQRGIKVNTQKVAELQKDYGERIENIQEQLWQMNEKKFDVASTQQLGDFLFRKLSLPIVNFTEETNQPSTNNKSLLSIVDKHPAVQLVLDFKKLTKLKSTYLDGIFKLLDKNNRVHTSFHVNGTETGRLSSSDPNLQNIPRDSEIRSIFCAEDGYVLVSRDFDQAELRIMAAFSGDKVFTDAFLTGKDVHAANAASIFRIPIEQVTSDQRTIGKTINFGIIYLMTAYGLAIKLEISEEEAQYFIDCFYAQHQEIKDWSDMIKRFVIKNRYVTNVFGRIRTFPYLDLEKFVGGTLREAVNFPIQSTCGDMTNIATIRNEDVVSVFNEENARLLLNVHDELLYEVKEGYAKDFETEIDKQMCKPYFNTIIPFTTDGKIMKEWKK